MKLKWILSLTATALIICVALLGLAQHDAVMAAQGNPEKIESALLDSFSTDGSADFIVRFADQADLSAAYSMDWDARGEYVYNTLTETATKSQANAISILDAAGVKHQTMIAGNDLYVWSGASTQANAIASLPEVYFIRAPSVYQLVPYTVLNPTQNITWAADFLANNLQVTVGNSPNATMDWGITDSKADQFWTTYGVEGAGVKVANIDTGVQYDHPALAAQYACIGDPGNASCWADPSNICGGTPCDNNGHGTHTMGTMVASNDPTLQYTAGMAPEATWIACKGCESTSCSELALTTCGTWLLAPGGNAANRPNVVNNSWGSPSDGNSWYLSYVNSWRAAGIFPAFSAGNNGSACDSMGDPGSYQQSFATAAHASNRTIASFSSRGPSAFGHDPYTKPNISAPGVSICSTVPGNGWNCGYSGTSMASPHNAGAVALLWSCNPSLVGQIDTTFQLLQNSADTPPAGDCGTPPDGQGNYTFGYGYLDVLAAGQTACGAVEQGTLQGHVYDQYDAPVVGASVTVQIAPEGNQTNALTDENGFYTMNLVPGTYDVTASKVNYQSQTATGVVIVAQQTTVQDFTINFLGSWTEEPALPAPCQDLTRFDGEYYNGLVYFLGGRGGTDGNATYGDVITYNPDTGVCADTGANIPNPVSNYTINLVNDGTDNLLCLFGGRLTSGSMTLDVQCYNPRLNSASKVANLPAAYTGYAPGAQVVLNNKVYIFGGFNGNLAPYELSRTDRYDPVSKSFTQLGNLSLARSYIDAAVVDGKIYAFGGTVYVGSNLTAQTRAEVMSNPEGAGTWNDAAVADLPSATAEGRAFGFDSTGPYEFGGQIIIAGGGQWPAETNGVIAYDVASNTYVEAFPNLVNARRDHAGVFIPGDAGEPGAMWVFGGRSGADLPPYAPPEWFPVAAEPIIDVTPESLSSTQAQNTRKTAQLNITNTGSGLLEWSLLEGAGMYVSSGSIVTAPTDTPSHLVTLALTSQPAGGAEANSPMIPEGSVALAVDDNSADNFIGLNSSTNGYQFMWLNRFTPNTADFPFTLEEIWTIIGTTGTTAGDPIELVVYEDTDGDGDPSDATLLATYSVTIQHNDGLTWNVYTLASPLFLSGPGDVLIGVINRYEVSGVEPPDFPAAIDQTITHKRSWVAAWSSDPPVPPVLPADDLWDLIDSFGFPGNWMIRGYGGTTDVPWLSEDMTAGTLEKGESVTINVTFDTTGLLPGVYHASLSIYSNDPDQPTVTVPVTLTVSNLKIFLPLATNR